MTANAIGGSRLLCIVLLAVLLVSRMSNAQTQLPTHAPGRTDDAARWRPEPGPPSSTSPIESARVVWPLPARNMDDQESLPQPRVESEIWDHAPYDEISAPMVIDHRTPHHVIQSPRRSPSKPGHASRSAETHPPHPRLLHHRVQSVVATVPDARSRETWKTPYSYGYFGASGKRQWSQHYGYRDRYTEWTLR